MMIAEGEGEPLLGEPWWSCDLYMAYIPLLDHMMNLCGSHVIYPSYHVIIPSTLASYVVVT